MNETAETAAQVSDQLYQAVLNRMNITWEPDEKNRTQHKKRHRRSPGLPARYCRKPRAFV